MRVETDVCAVFSMAKSKTPFWLWILLALVLLGGVYYFQPSGSSGESGLPTDCLLPKEVGPCRAAMPRFYYNKEKKVCEQFIYGGCPGNNNNFKTKEDCDKICRHP